MATTNLGRIGFVLQGAWAAGTYKHLDVVQHASSAWGCVVLTTTEEPGVGTDWVQLLSTTNVPAGNTTVLDAAGYFTTENVEAILQELGVTTQDHEGRLDTHEGRFDTAKKFIGSAIMLHGMTIQTSAADNTWYSITWSPELGLFAAVAANGIENRVMTSPDGINWTTRTSAADNNWYSIAWSPELGLFAAVAINGTGNRVMTSKV